MHSTEHYNAIVVRSTDSACGLYRTSYVFDHAEYRENGPTLSALRFAVLREFGESGVNVSQGLDAVSWWRDDFRYRSDVDTTESVPDRFVLAGWDSDD